MTSVRVDPAANSGTWTTAGLLVGAYRQPELSHLSFRTSGPFGGTDQPEAPEPATCGRRPGRIRAVLALPDRNVKRETRLRKD